MKKEVNFEVFIDGTLTHTKKLNGIKQLKEYLMETDDSLSYFNAETAYIFECNDLYSEYLKSYLDEEKIISNPDEPYEQLNYFNNLKDNLICYDNFIKDNVDKSKFNNFKTGLYDYMDFYDGNWICKYILEEDVDNEQMSKTNYYNSDDILIKENAELKTKITWIN